MKSIEKCRQVRHGKVFAERSYIKITDAIIYNKCIIPLRDSAYVGWLVFNSADRKKTEKSKNSKGQQATVFSTRG
jgi:hypothetical protein